LIEKVNVMKKKPELLAPAGNYEKFETAVRYGADAVYLAGQMFGMRAAADNFTYAEIERAAKYAHDRGVKVYVTVNTMPHVLEYPALADYLKELGKTGIDALIVADLGVAALARELVPNVQMHISTQAGSVSHADCIAWHKLGASRIVLARELTLNEIKEIRRRVPEEIELEVFVHGSMCVSWSGRCLLSASLIGRDANRGMCAQPCRWNYKLYSGNNVKNENKNVNNENNKNSGTLQKGAAFENGRFYEIEEESRPGQRYPVEEDELGTFIMSSKDLCMIEHVGELCEAGINSFKIEGRMKSAYYTAVASNAYRMAIDSWSSGVDLETGRLLEELESVSHREYGTGFFYDDCDRAPQLISDVSRGYIREKAYLAIAESYDAETGLAGFIQRNKFKAGDAVKIISPGRLSREFIAEELYDDRGESIPAVPHPYMKFKVRVPFEIKLGDIMRGA